MVVTVQEHTRDRYPLLVGKSLLGALVVLAVVFLFTPAFAPQPYELAETPCELVDIPDDIIVPPPLPDAPMPRPRRDFIVDDNAPDDQTIDDSNPDLDEFPPPPPLDHRPGPGKFIICQKLPEPVFKVKPAYPRLAREAEMEGVVHILVHVDERGRVVRVEVTSSNVPQVLEQAALAAARKWRFTAARQGRRPVASTINLPFEFVLH